MGRVFVAGSINMDVVATADRHPRSGETVAGKEILYFPGGKGANQAVSAAKLGATAILVGRLGMDAFGRDLKLFLAGQGVDLSLVRETQEAHTGTAIITVANSDNTIVVIPGANALVTPDDVATAPLAKGDITISQFEIPLPAISAFFTRARSAGATTILNPAPAIKVGRELLDLVDILILNETELGLLAERTTGHHRSHTAHRSCQSPTGRHRQSRLRHIGRAWRAGSDRWKTPHHSRPCGQSRRYDRRRGLLCRCGGRAARRQPAHSERAGIRQCRSVNLSAADRSGAINADDR